MLLYRPQIAIPLVKHQSHVEVGARPRHVIVVKLPEIRAHIRNRPVFPLCFRYVLQPFGIQEIIVENIAFPECAGSPVPEPPESLVPLRAVGRHSMIVAPYTPGGIPVYAVDNGVGCREAA